MAVVDDGRVRQFIDWAMKCASQGGALDTNETVRRAWLAAKDQRRTDAYDQDPDLAAAEHYLYARFLSGLTGDPLTQLAPTLYDLKKMYNFATGNEKAMRTDSTHPALAPNLRIWWWGNKGANQGLQDFRSAHPNEGYRYGSAVEGLAKDAKYSDNTAAKIGSLASASYLRRAPTAVRK